MKAVVMETTGDVSVLHHDDKDYELDSVLLKGVRGWSDDDPSFAEERPNLSD